jgi:peptidyl-tRNA hydrolase
MGDATAQEEVPRLVQHVILRKDLTKPPFSWPAGSMIAQGCHVVSKTLWELKEEPNVVAYMADIDNMHKVTLMAKDEEELRAVIEALTENGIHFRRCRGARAPRRMFGVRRAACCPTRPGVASGSRHQTCRRARELHQRRHAVSGRTSRTTLGRRLIDG